MNAVVRRAPELPQPAFLEIGRGLTRGDTPRLSFYPQRRSALIYKRFRGSYFSVSVSRSIGAIS